MCLARSLVLESFFLWLLLASDACHCLWPCPALSVCVLRTQPVVFTSYSATFYASAILPTPSMSCCRFWCQSSAGCPCREPCTCVLFRPFCICFFFVSTGFVGSLRNPRFISLYPCFSAQTFQNFALDNMIIMFFTSSAQVPV